MTDEPSEDSQFEDQMAGMDSEIIQLIRRSDTDEVEVDEGDLDPDAVISILTRALFRVLAEETVVEYDIEFGDPDDEVEDSDEA